MFKMFRRTGPTRKPTGAAIVLAGLMLTAPAAPAPAADGAQPAAPRAAAAVETLTQRTLRVMRDGSLDTAARQVRLARVLRRALDLPTITSFVMGRHGDSLSEAERARFREAFGDYVVQTYARMLARQAVADIRVTDSREVTPTTAAVSTHVTRGEDNQATWTWRLHERGGRYRVVDLQTRGVSLAVTYRSEFGGALARGELDGVIERLRDQSAMGDTMRFERLALIQLLRGFGGGQLALTAR